MSLERMTVYLKSGSKFVLEGVLNWEIQSSNGKFNSLSLEQMLDRKRLIVNTLDFESVAAITVEPMNETETANVDA